MSNKPKEPAQPPVGLRAYLRSRSSVYSIGIGFLIGLILCLVTVGYVYKEPLGKAYQKSTAKHIDPYTELYFTSPNDLPATFAPDTLVPLAVTLHNHEGHAIEYRVRVYIDGKVVEPDQKIAAENNELKVFPVEVRIPAGDIRRKVTIELIDQRLAIHVWLNQEPRQ